MTTPQANEWQPTVDELLERIKDVPADYKVEFGWNGDPVEPGSKALQSRKTLEMWLSGLMRGDEIHMRLRGVPCVLRPLDFYNSVIFRIQDYTGSGAVNIRYLQDAIFGEES